MDVVPLIGRISSIGPIRKAKSLVRPLWADGAQSQGRGYSGSMRTTLSSVRWLAATVLLAASCDGTALRPARRAPQHRPDLPRQPRLGRSRRVRQRARRADAEHRRHRRARGCGSTTSTSSSRAPSRARRCSPARYAVRSGAAQPSGITQWEITIAEALKSRRATRRRCSASGTSAASTGSRDARRSIRASTSGTAFR